MEEAGDHTGKSAAYVAPSTVPYEYPLQMTVSRHGQIIWDKA